MWFAEQPARDSRESQNVWPLLEDGRTRAVSQREQRGRGARCHRPCCTNRKKVGLVRGDRNTRRHRVRCSRLLAGQGKTWLCPRRLAPLSCSGLACPACRPIVHVNHDINALRFANRQSNLERYSSQNIGDPPSTTQQSFDTRTKCASMIIACKTDQRE